MDRREFFRKSFGKASETVVREIDNRIEERARHWIRPPFAISEIEFLLACTRCHACIDVCPQQVIFALPARLGTDVVGTPALDLLNRTCVMCEDWPCVSACEPLALNRTADDALPRLAHISIDTATCLPYQGPECGVCVDACPVEGAMSFVDMVKPLVHAELCTGCAQCREVCVVDPAAITIQSLSQARADD